MNLQFFSDKLLLKRMETENEGLTFLFGSAFSAIKDGSGIPNVSQVTEIIEEYVRELDLLDDYKAHISECDEKERYQESFAFLSAIMGASSTKEIVKRVVMKNYDTETETHRVPKAIQDFVRCIKQNKIKVKNILTTNFDTLIEEQFKKEGILYNSISIVSDSNINENDNGLINIIHLHGTWNLGDTMHTRNQLDSKREKIEASLRNNLTEQHVIVMAYGGWVDSFTRTLANIVNDSKAEYNIAWCFYEKEPGVIDRNEKNLIETLTPAINRDRVHFFKGIDCNNIFSQIISKYEVKKKEEQSLIKNSQDDINYCLFDEKSFSKKIRQSSRQKAIEILNREKSLFIEAGLGYGLYDFISSLINTVRDKKKKCLKIDLSEVISKNQIDDKVKSDTGQHLSYLIYLLTLDKDTIHFVIFDNIRRNADAETFLYLLKLPEQFSQSDSNIYFIYSSTTNISTFYDISVQLRELTLHETGIILRDKFGTSRLTPIEISQFYEQSEGVLTKLEQIMFFLESSSAQEVLSQDDIFDDTFHYEHIPSTIIKQIDRLISDPNKKLTLKMLNILSILKNGETLSNLRKDSAAVKLSPRNTKELIQLELANTLYIDRTTTLIRINPIIKDYILSKIPLEEKFEIANSYLKVLIEEKSNGVTLSSINRKIYENGYNTEEDNTSTVLKLSIQDSKIISEQPGLSENSKEMNNRRLNKLLHLSRSYVYILCNSSRFNEAIFAIDSLIDVIKDVDTENIYKYYHHIAYAHRMKSNDKEAAYYIKMCEKLCPESDKKTLESIYKEKLHLLEDEDIDKAIEFAKKNKNNHHRNSSAYILSEVIITHEKVKPERVKSLEKLEKKARKLEYHTLANNILFTLNKERNDIDKIDRLNKVIKTDNSSYNICRAIIYKHEVLVRNNSFDKIKDSDIEKLINIYNYLFRQKFDALFNKCHSILWSIAEYRKNNELIILIFYKGTIVWKLNSDIEMEEKYTALLNRLDGLDQIPLLGNTP